MTVHFENVSANKEAKSREIEIKKKQWGQKGDKMFNFELTYGLKVKFTLYGIEQIGVIRGDKSAGFFIKTPKTHCYSIEAVHDLRPAKGFYPVMGDVLVDICGYELKVLGVCGNAYFLSEANKFEKSNLWYTREELINEGYKIKGQQETITLEEAEKRLGVRIEKV